VDEDCPAQDDQGNALVCGDAGACVPADDGGGDGDTCEVGEACQGCQGELGCVCRTTPRGAACVPACESDEDCPGEGPNGSALVCRPAGFCGPDRM
jgi:hypothetical protein